MLGLIGHSPHIHSLSAPDWKNATPGISRFSGHLRWEISCAIAESVFIIRSTTVCFYSSRGDQLFWMHFKVTHTPNLCKGRAGNIMPHLWKCIVTSLQCKTAYIDIDLGLWNWWMLWTRIHRSSLIEDLALSPQFADIFSCFSTSAFYLASNCCQLLSKSPGAVLVT